MVERALQRAQIARRRALSERSAPATSAAPAPARAGSVLLVGLLGVVTVLLGFAPGPLGLDFGGLELGGDQRVVLGTQVDLLEVVGGHRVVGGILAAYKIVLALELLDVADAHLELMGHPCVGAALPDPGADLV